MDYLKIFQIYTNFVMETLINVLLLKKGAFLYEYMNSWKRFDEATLPNKEAFQRKLYLEDISDEDYIHAQKVFKEFGIKNLGEYHDMFICSK